MFEKSPTWRRIAGEPNKVIRIHLGYVPELDTDPDEERRGVRWAILGAVVLHIVLFLVHIPLKASRPEWKGREQKVFQVRQLQLKQRELVPQKALPKPRRAVKRIPIPDPTPDEPEPILLEEMELPVLEFEFPESEIDAFFIPEGPPGLLPGGGNPSRVGGDVAPPVKLSGDRPLYTEEARQGRVQGVVILEAVIDQQGDVLNVRVLKGLDLGLTESAVHAARGWKFKPALRGSEPVAVFYNLTVRSSLQ